jgi:hypothetical protein
METIFLAFSVRAINQKEMIGAAGSLSFLNGEKRLGKSSQRRR